MGDIIEKRRRDYSGLDADKASIPAGGKSVNDTFLATDTKILYFWDGVAWIIIPLDVIVAGMIKTDAIETLKIKDINVTAAKLATNSVETAKIKDLNVTVGKLAGGITATKLAADCVETAKVKDLNVTKGKAELGFGRYVPRLTNAVDKDETDFTHDSNWHVDGLDLSGIVPAGAVGVVLALNGKSTGAGTRMWFRHSAGSAKTDGYLRIDVGGLFASSHIVLPIESNRLVDYNSSMAGADGTTREFELVVVAWFI